MTSPKKKRAREAAEVKLRHTDLSAIHEAAIRRTKAALRNRWHRPGDVFTNILRLALRPIVNIFGRKENFSLNAKHGARSALREKLFFLQLRREQMFDDLGMEKAKALRGEEKKKLFTSKIP
jgi:hypothetical protein